MPNTKSAKKAVRGSDKKNKHNLFWKRRFKRAIKSLQDGIDEKEDIKILNEKLLVLQKMLDKSSKEKVIHKNKANRLKSKYAQRISVQVSKDKKPAKKAGTK